MQLSFFRLVVLVISSTLLFSVACGTASQSQTTEERPSDPSVVARVGDREITLSDLDDKVMASNMNVFQELYNARRDALGALVAEALLEEEAKGRGVSVDDLVQQEITSNVSPVTQSDIEAFYEQNKARLGGQTIEQISGQIREYLMARNEAVVRQSYIDGLREKANVAISLEPPRVPIVVADGERMKGPADAEVTIVEYSDFQ